MSLFERLESPHPSSRALLLMRLAVGGVFFASGMVKLLFENQGELRFAKLGFPHGVASLVALVEIIGGLLVVTGLFARLSALALATDMVVAVATTKLPLLFGAGPEPVAALPKVGLWAFAYQARLDLALLLLCTGLALAGAGALSLDAWRSKRRSVLPEPSTI